MQKKLGIALTVLLVAIAWLLSVTNQTEIVLEIPRLTAAVPPDPVHLSLGQFIFVLLTAGFGAGILVGWGSGLRYRRSLKKLQRQHSQLEEELRNLRNLPLEQDIHI